MKFIAFSSSLKKLINSPRWNFNLIFFLFSTTHLDGAQNEITEESDGNYEKIIFYENRDRLVDGVTIK